MLRKEQGPYHIVCILSTKKYNCTVGRFKSDFTDLKILLKGRRPQFLMVLHQ